MGTVVQSTTPVVSTGLPQNPGSGYTITGTTAGNALLIVFSGNQYTNTNPKLVSGFSASAGTTPVEITQQPRGAYNDAWVGAYIVPSGPGGSVTYTPQFTVNNSNNAITITIIEISGLNGSPIDAGATIGFGDPATNVTVSAGPSATLAQADSMVIALCTAQGSSGTNANIANTAGSYTLVRAQQDWSIGNSLWIGYKNVAATTAVSASFTYNSAQYGGVALIIVLKNGAAAAQRFKFQTDPSAVNASGVSAVVWETSGGIVGNKVAEYTGLSFQSAAIGGQAVLYASATGKGYTNGTSMKGIAFNTTNTTGIITITVEAGSA